MLLLLTACAQPAAPPPPPAPEPATATEARKAQTVVRGTVLQPLGDGGFADVTIWYAGSSCETTEVAARTRADHAGRFEVTIEQRGNDCIVGDATAAGASGRASVLPRNGSPPPAVVELQIRLSTPSPLTRSAADALASALQKAVNDDDQQAIDFLAPHFLLHDAEGMRTGIEHLRIHLGTIVATSVVDERHEDRFDEFVYELTGSNGTKTRFPIQQGPRRNAFHPVIQTASRANRYVGTFARLVAANDVEKLARLLTADDIDYPVEKARAVIARYRELAGLESARTVFTGFDEARSTLRYRIEGRRRDGTTASVPIELGYGDGLLWLRE